MARCREPGRTREQGRGPRRVRGLSVTEAPTERALQLQHSARRPPPPPPQPPAADPLDLLDGEPVAAQVLHGVYVIVAEEAQADLAERAGRHRLCHSHLRGRGVRRAAHPHTPGNLLLRQSARLAGWEGSHWPHQKMTLQLTTNFQSLHTSHTDLSRKVIAFKNQIRETMFL